MRAAALGVAAAALTFAAGVVAGRGLTASPPPAPKIATLACTAEVAELRRDIAGLVRERPARIECQPAVDAVALKAEPPPPEPTRENLEAYDLAAATVRAAIDAHSWRDEHRRELRRVLGKMDAAQQLEVMQTLAVGINDGTLHVDVSGPPF